MTDLYDHAAALPRLLRGEREPHRFGELRAAGATRRQIHWAVARDRLVRVFHDAYLPGSGPADLLSVLRAAQRLLPPASVFSHHTAAALHGFGVLTSTTVHVTVPAGTPVPQRRGITAHESALPRDDAVEVLGLPCLPPARCAVELARSQPRMDGLAVLDAALRAGVVTDDELFSEVLRHDRLRGVRRARELLPLADPLAECRQETGVRLLLHDANLPRPRLQLVVADEWGVERYWLDLGYEEEQVGIEYDGASHLDRRRIRSDRQRHNWLAQNGWRMRYFTDDDLYRRPEALVQMVRATLFGPRSWNSTSRSA
jgi:very-short-patch-repair endonuclease